MSKVQFCAFVKIIKFGDLKFDRKIAQLWGKREFLGKYNKVTFLQLLFHLSLQKKVIVTIFERGWKIFLPSTFFMSFAFPSLFCFSPFEKMKFQNFSFPIIHIFLLSIWAFRTNLTYRFASEFFMSFAFPPLFWFSLLGEKGNFILMFEHVEVSFLCVALISSFFFLKFPLTKAGTCFLWDVKCFWGHVNYRLKLLFFRIVSLLWEKKMLSPGIIF